MDTDNSISESGLPGMPPPDATPPLSDEDVAHIKAKYYDLPYASGSETQKLDLYLPNEQREPAPLIVYFHGGAFAFGEKRFSDLLPMLRGIERGYAVASVEYRKSGEARFPAMVYDAKAAIRFLRSAAKEYNLDPGRIAAWGASSGAWLVSMLGVTAGNPAFEDLSMGCAGFSSDVQAVVDWCGPCGNFLAMDEMFKTSGKGDAVHSAPNSPESMFLGVEISKVPELCRLACPCTYVGLKTPPFLVMHGEADPVVPVEQSLTFFDALQKTGGNGHRLHVAEGKPHHGPPSFWFNEPWVSDICFDFLSDVWGESYP